MNMARNTVLYCTYCTYCTYCYPQRSAGIKLGWEQAKHLEVSLSISQYVRARAAFLGRGYHWR
jgi:hypothetical protein